LDQEEECDDENTEDGDGCDSLCVIEKGFECPSSGKCTNICGDGIIVLGETCDPGENDVCTFMC